jgi:drug/metabolite transporter (DMT)-like permease
MRAQVKNVMEDLFDTIRSTLQPLRPSKQTDRTRALFAVGIVSLLWGTTWLASARGIAHMPALQMAGIRQLIGGGVYIAYFRFKGFKWPNRAALLQFTWMSVVMFVVSNGLSTWSVKYIPSGLGAVIGAIAPIWIAVFSLFMFKDTRINRTTGLGLLLGFGGIVVIFYEYFDAILNSSFSIGLLMGLVATMTWGLGTLFTVKHARNINPYYSIGWQMFISGLILTAIAVMSGQRIPITEIPAESWYAIAYMVIAGSVIAFAAFIYALKRLPAAQASVYAYINPVVAVAIGSLLNNEKLTMLIAVGTMITLFGVYLVNTGFRKSS